MLLDDCIGSLLAQTDAPRDGNRRHQEASTGDSDAEEKMRLLEAARPQNVDGHKGVKEAHVTPEETKEQPAIKETVRNMNRIATPHRRRLKDVAAYHDEGMAMYLEEENSAKKLIRTERGVLAEIKNILGGIGGGPRRHRRR